MRLLLKILISGISVMIASYILPGVNVENFSYALMLAAVLAFLNATLKPMLVLLTIPFTVFTLGLFLLVINAVIILIASDIVPGFHVSGFWSALFFSIILSIITSTLESLNSRFEKDNN